MDIIKIEWLINILFSSIFIDKKFMRRCKNFWFYDMISASESASNDIIIHHNFS